ncbi:protein mono-ADP-ribosyltransferase PARP14 isoform X2 [Aplysia californica]|uniref:Poly [ADP-ribose] polymerase n=1 Tax=Aplysia californica TaxID=6500 RepID=A0ABM1VQI1_APLCA|nr:protein mono-ADP-ribosyltransferase PARP14 isoform X2 [Aplysia californica]
MADFTGDPKNVSLCPRTVIKVQVQDAKKAKDFYINYFDAPAIKTGNIKEDTMLLDGLHKCVYIEFEESKGASDMCKKEHKVTDNIVSVCMAKEEEYLFHYNLMSLHGQDFSNGKIMEYIKYQIENATGFSVKEQIQQEEVNSIIIGLNMTTYTDLSTLLWQCRELFLDTPVVVAPVLLTSSVLVSGLKEDITDASLERYFENPGRSGGGLVQQIQRRDFSSAVVEFQNTSTLLSVKSREHQLEDSKLTITEYFPCLSSKAWKYSQLPLEDPDAIRADASNPEEAASDAPQQEVIAVPVGGKANLVLLERSNSMKILKETHHDVLLEMDTTRSSVLISGGEEDERKDVQMSILEETARYKSLVPNLETSQTKLLQSPFLKTRMNHILREKGIEAIIEDTTSGVAVTYKNDNVMKSAEVSNKLKTFLPVVKRAIGSNEKCLWETEHGKDFLLKLQNLTDRDNQFLGVDILVDPTESFMCITAFQEDQPALKAEIDKFLKENELKSFEISFSESCQTFMDHFLQTDLKTLENALSKSGSQMCRNTDKITLNGFVPGVKEGKKLLSKIRDKIKVKETTIKHFGIKEFLSNDEGRHILESVGSRNSCVVKVSEKPAAGTARQEGSVEPVVPPSEVAMCQVGRTKITFAQGNILGIQQIDALVNPLDAKNGLSYDTRFSLGKAVLANGGQAIARELREARSGSTVGTVIRTSGGELSSFSNIFHFICPVNYGSGNEAELLEQAVLQCLKKAVDAGSKSIAVPAVGVDDSSGASRGAAGVDHQSYPSGIVKFGHIDVAVKSGQILDEKSDVIVTTVDKSLDLCKGRISKLVLERGGQAVQDELEQRYQGGIQPGDFAVSSSGNLGNKSLFHACLKRWGGNAEVQLKALVDSILKEASSLQAASISLCALGTGGLRYPADNSAKCIMDSIRQFAVDNPSSSLQSVVLVIHERSQDVLQAFQRASSGHGLAASPTPRQGGSPSLRYGSLDVKIQKGDITTQSCDVIVAGLKETMNLSGSGAVSKTILKKCGSAVQDECNAKKNNMASAKCIVTGSHGLQCKHIIFLSMEHFAHSWDKGVALALNEADKLGLKSVSMPAFGTARPNTYVKMKEQILGTIKKFGEGKPQSLTNVQLVIFGQDVLDVFLGNTKAPQESAQQLNVVSQSVQVEIVFSDDTQFEKVAKSVAKECGKAYKIKEEKKEHFKRLTESQVKELKAECLKKRVKATVDTSKGCITLEGFSVHLAQEILHSMHLKAINEQFAQTSVAFHWQYMSRSRFRDFDPQSNISIETAYNTYKGNQKHPGDNRTYHFTVPNGKSYIIDFKDMKEQEVDDQGKPVGNDIKIQRYNILQESLPLHKAWVPMPDGRNMLLVDIKNDSAEFKKVEKAFHDKGETTAVKKIQRVQSVSLYQQYKAKKKELERHNPKDTKNEKRLYHGTDSQTVSAILENGFNRNYCGKNATMYGEGVYFSELSSYSSRYSQADGNGLKRMFQARVLVGVSTPGQSGMRALPLRTGTRPFDSATGPNMFIIFHDSQTYPEYVIYF